MSAFRLSGVEGVISCPDNASAKLEEIVGKRDAGIVLLTNELGLHLQARIRDINLNVPDIVVIETPSVDDTEGLRRSAISYVAEALGIAL